MPRKAPLCKALSAIEIREKYDLEWVDLYIAILGKFITEGYNAEEGTFIVDTYEDEDEDEELARNERFVIRNGKTISIPIINMSKDIDKISKDIDPEKDEDYRLENEELDDLTILLVEQIGLNKVITHNLIFSLFGYKPLKSIYCNESNMKKLDKIFPFITEGCMNNYDCLKKKYYKLPRSIRDEVELIFKEIIRRNKKQSFIIESENYHSSEIKENYNIN